jgi:glycosyltransferase involved in cell wall biosynthesis
VAHEVLDTSGLFMQALLRRPLEIALLSTSALATPPSGYGGTELFVADLAQALSELGHWPTVFATGDSHCTGTLRWTFEKPVWPPCFLSELRHAGFAWHEIARGSFDVVHVNHAAALPFQRLVGVPTAATIHHDREEALVAHYASYPEVSFVAISKRQCDLSPEIRFRSVIHHGLDPDRYPLGSGAEGYTAFLGRFAPGKGTHTAIDAALSAGASIRLGGLAHPTERPYFEREIKPRLSLRGVQWLGEVGGARKTMLLGGASCLLMPLDWEEPFGLCMIEAMMVGTPVIAFPRGSAPEVIEHGVTGYLVRSKEEMTERIRTIERFDRRKCRVRACERWSAARMARDYVALYSHLIAAHRPRTSGIVLRGGGSHGRTSARTGR